MGCRWLRAGLLAAISVQSAAAADIADLARRFGAREAARSVTLSPEGKQIAFITPAVGARSALAVADIATGKVRGVLTDGGTAIRLRHCAWKSETRLICTFIGVTPSGGSLFGYRRIMAVDTDGKRQLVLGQTDNANQLASNQSINTKIVDLLPDDPDNILMAINIVPEMSTGTRLAQTGNGLAVERVNIRTNSRAQILPPRYEAQDYGSDGHGHVRTMAIASIIDGEYQGSMRWLARAPGSDAWQQLLSFDMRANATPSVDGLDAAGEGVFLLKPKDGRMALYRHRLDQPADELVYANDKVDVDGLWRIGKYERPVAVEYTEDARALHYLDTALEKTATALTKALPGHTQALVVDEDWSGANTLVFAGSDVNPGKYYRYTPATHELNELIPVHVALDGLTLSEQTPVRFAAKDGTQIPAYLTLPPGKTSAKGLPAIVMPHGGPSARDQWGYDWLSQYFAQLGYAVLQPNYRGSTGYGEAWYQQNGFQSWRTAMGDINDGARWLLSQGADAKRLGIVGWSYGGYAALQANVLEPTLYRATVAIAPVTDLPQLREAASLFANKRLQQAFIGSGPQLAGASPARNAGVIQTPVLMFQGTLDTNVDQIQAKTMDAALARAGKKHELVMYPGLAHDLADSSARADMLKRSAEFLAANMPAA